MDNGGNSEEPSEKVIAAMRVLERAASIPLDQAGPVMIPPLTKWQILRHRVACAMGRHSWGPSWTYLPLVPAEYDVARMLADGACWPEYESKVCRGCGVMHRRRVS